MGAIDAAAMPQTAAFTPSAGFPSLVATRMRTTAHAGKVGTHAGKVATRGVKVAAHARKVAAAPRTIMDLLMPRTEPPPRPKARVSSLPQAPQP